MPIYEYQCSDCSNEFELLLFGEQQPVCPHCGSVALSRQMSVPAGHVSHSSQHFCPASEGPCQRGRQSCCAGCPGN